MSDDSYRPSRDGRGQGRPSSRGRSTYSGSRASANGARGGTDRLRGQDGPQVRTGKRGPYLDTHDWSTGKPLPRRSVVSLLLGLGGLACVGRLVDYQIVNAGELRDRADARRLLSETLYAKRGTIYDRNGNVLASSVECRNVAVNPQLVKDVDKTVSALVKATGVDRKTVRKLLKSDGSWVYIKRQVDEDDAKALEKKNLPGVMFEQAMKRVYPYGNLASQVLGVVNVDNKGLTGLEKQYDKMLTGTNGSLVRERARDGGYIAGGAYKKVAAVDGADIVTTIDVNIQRTAEDALAKSVEQTKAKYGSAVVTDPTTGEILAACSYPTYDQTDLENARSEDMNLRLVTDAYEPGSVFKTLVAGAGIDLGKITSETDFQVPVSVKVGDDTVTDADKRDYGMTMTVREMLRRSSNVGFVLVGEKIGAEDFSKYVKKWGIGHSSGVDFPGESLGIVKKLDEYDGATLGSMSFGQALSVSPIEITRAVGGIANGGRMMTPHFYKSSKGEEKDWGRGKRVISKDAAAQVVSCMQTVVEEGTGKGGAVEGYDVAGKTGTAERASEKGGYQKENYMSSFMGFAPASSPKVLCYITLDGTPQGSDAAAIPFQTIMADALTTLGIQRTS